MRILPELSTLSIHHQFSRNDILKKSYGYAYRIIRYSKYELKKVRKFSNSVIEMKVVTADILLSLWKLKAFWKKFLILVKTIVTDFIFEFLCTVVVIFQAWGKKPKLCNFFWKPCSTFRCSMWWLIRWCYLTTEPMLRTWRT